MLQMLGESPWGWPALLAKQLSIEALRTPPLGLVNLVKWFTDLRKALYLCFPIYCKGYYKKSRWTVNWEGCQELWSPPSPCPCVQQSRSYESPSWGFKETSSCRQVWLHHWPLVVNSTFIPSGAEMKPVCITMWQCHWLLVNLFF
jgi:hypothetical protein